jgi:hypothetical protein
MAEYDKRIYQAEQKKYGYWGTVSGFGQEQKCRTVDGAAWYFGQ